MTLASQAVAEIREFSMPNSLIMVQRASLLTPPVIEDVRILYDVGNIAMPENEGQFGSHKIIESYPRPTARLMKVKIHFKNSKSLIVSHFSRDNDGKYHAFVSNFWIYRNIKLEFSDKDRSKASLQIFVMESETQSNESNMSDALYSRSGPLYETTTNSVADKVVASMDGEKVTLLLHKYPVMKYGSDLFSNHDDEYGIKILVKRLGKADKNILFQIPKPTQGLDLGLAATSISAPDVIEKNTFSGSISYKISDDMSGAAILNLYDEITRP